MKIIPKIDYHSVKNIEKLLLIQKMPKQRISLVLPKPIVQLIDLRKNKSRSEYIAQAVLEKTKKAKAKKKAKSRIINFDAFFDKYSFEADNLDSLPRDFFYE